MIDIASGLLTELCGMPRQDGVEIGISKIAGTTTVKEPIVPRADIDGEECRLYLRTSRTKRGKHTEIGLGKLFFSEGRVGVRMADHPDHYGSDLLAQEFLGVVVTIAIECV